MTKYFYHKDMKIDTNGRTILVLATMLTLAVGVILSTTISQSEAREIDCRAAGKLWISHGNGAGICVPWPAGCPDPDRTPKCPTYGGIPVAPIEEPPTDVVQEPTDEEPPADEPSGDEPPADEPPAEGEGSESNN